MVMISFIYILILASLVAVLGMQDVDEGQHIFQRDVTLYGMCRGENVSTIGAGVKELFCCVSYILR